MDFGPALAILIIAVFVVLILLGRSAAGRAALERTYGRRFAAEPPKPAKPAKRGTATKRTNGRARAAGRNTASKSATTKQASKPGTSRRAPAKRGRAG